VSGYKAIGATTSQSLDKKHESINGVMKKALMTFASAANIAAVVMTAASGAAQAWWGYVVRLLLFAFLTLVPFVALAQGPGSSPPATTSDQILKPDELDALKRLLASPAIVAAS
jgi:hypothetical protein